MTIEQAYRLAERADQLRATLEQIRSTLTSSLATDLRIHVALDLANQELDPEASPNAR